jgi:hypothetical protein
MKFIVEFEGFSFHRGFIFKEISILGLDNSISKHFFVKSPMRFEGLSHKEKRITRYCENELHQIFWFAGKDKFSDVLQFMKDTLVAGSTVYTKGLQKIQILWDLNLACHIEDTETYLPESLEKHDDIDKMIQNTSPCPLSFHRKTLHCSHIKSVLLKDLLLKLENEHLYQAESEIPEEADEMQVVQEESGH